ncbi:hypothetical protein [Myxococcus landrumensis]|uniref:Lipoprotein n=1 Tax=Myxococcus landrumensis TaxID=2813577 RepID=A0ABX7NEU7_9BACT|nr:hypothetical protein [Myxococcus landrumus]QSQ17315.1 hypothetical protein JY572_15160 [Myxococcus landrumus]
MKSLLKRRTSTEAPAASAAKTLCCVLVPQRALRLSALVLDAKRAEGTP